MALDAHYIALILYASIYVLLVLAVSLYVYYARKAYAADSGRGLTDKDGNPVPDNYCKQMLYAREIYTACVVHLYDQATDVAVMVQWGQLLQQEIDGENLEGVNMYSFFFPGLGFIILYRIITMFFAFYENTRYGREKKKLKKKPENKDKDSSFIENELKKMDVEQQSFWSGIWDMTLAAFDLYFLKVVYKEFQDGYYKPNQIHRSLQLCEALFERYLHPLSNNL